MEIVSYYASALLKRLDRPERISFERDIQLLRDNEIKYIVQRTLHYTNILVEAEDLELAEMIL